MIADQQLALHDGSDAGATLDAGGMELSLPAGGEGCGPRRVLGNRSFAMYYRQRHPVADTRQSVAVRFHVILNFGLSSRILSSCCILQAVGLHHSATQLRNVLPAAPPRGGDTTVCCVMLSCHSGLSFLFTSSASLSTWVSCIASSSPSSEQSGSITRHCRR